MLVWDCPVTLKPSFNERLQHDVVIAATVSTRSSMCWYIGLRHGPYYGGRVTKVSRLELQQQNELVR